MAQCKVTDFYAVQKKTSDVQPSKRRKVIRMNEPSFLTAKKNRKGDLEAPTLVVTSGPSSNDDTLPQPTDFQPAKTPEINFTATNNNNEGETVVFSAQPAPAEEPSKPSRVTRSKKASAKSDSASQPAAAKSRPKRGTGGGRRKKKTDDADEQPQQKDIRDAIAAPQASAPAPAEVVGEEATAHDNDHELVVTPPSSPSTLKEIQQSRKRPKKVAVIVRVTEEGQEEAGAGGEGGDAGRAEEGTPRKLKKTEEGPVTPKRTPHQMLSPGQMLTPSPKTVGCLPGSVKKLTLSSARKKLNLGGDDALNASVQSLKSESAAGTPAKSSPILEKARNLMKRLSESVSPSASPTSSPRPAASEAPTDEGAAASTTPSKGKGKGKGSSNRVEELKRKIKEAKEKPQEDDGSKDEASAPKQGLDGLISRLGKNNKKTLQQQSAAPGVEHGPATQAKSGKLLELQAKLKAIDKEKRALKQDIGKEQGKTTTTAVTTTTTTTATTTKATKESANVSAAETSTKKQPAHEKYAHLAEKVDAPNGELPLPFKYKMLLEFFRNMDQAVSLYYNRKEMITFSKLKGAVQELTRRSFDEKHLGQIMTVYPESYELRREKAKNLYGMKNLNNYELTVEPRLNGASANCDVRPSMSAANLLNRRHKFHHSLINVLRKQHTKFLESLTPPVKVDEMKVQRWHPKFKLEELPEVTIAALPEAPEVEKFSTAKEVLDKAKGSMNERIEAALKQMAESKESAKPNSKEADKPAASPAPAPPKKAATKGIPPSLLAKIREKEAKKAVENLVMTSEASERVNMLGRLPDFVKILRTFFLTEKKPALLIEDVVKKVSDSHRSALAGSAVDAHVKLIAEVAPEWLTITKLSSGTYVKINKTMDINKILETVEKEKKRTNS